jgi:CBS domain-containing protein
MSSAVVLVPKEMSLPAAAHLLSQSHVSGAPVVDDEGRCIGVLSNTDFLHYAELGKRRKTPHGPQQALSSWQIVAQDEPSGDRVADYMTTDPVTAPARATIGELARMMIDAHIHRVVVVDERQRPIGIVSSTDILAAVAQADARE